MAQKMSVLFRSSLVTLDELTREVGRWRALRLMGEVGRRNLRGMPFNGLPPCRDARDTATREELIPAVNLYQVLLEVMPEDQAFQVARRVILNGSLFHLRSIYPSFHGRDFLSLADGDPATAGARLGAEFAFADTQVLEMTRDRAAFDVTHCRIPSILAEVGAERLGPIFCEVDAIYFPIYEPDVELVRTQTIIRGGKLCDFRLSWKV